MRRRDMLCSAVVTIMPGLDRLASGCGLVARSASAAPSLSASRELEQTLNDLLQSVPRVLIHLERTPRYRRPDLFDAVREFQAITVTMRPQLSPIVGAHAGTQAVLDSLQRLTAAIDDCRPSTTMEDHHPARIAAFVATSERALKLAGMPRRMGSDQRP